MTTVAPHLSGFWQAFLASCPGADAGRYYEDFYFGDSQELADTLADLVLSGTKRATASALWTYELEKSPLPRPGDLSIVTNWSGTPLCVIETRAVAIMAFRDVGAEFAALEGEGDRSLAYWRQAHRDFFSRECGHSGRRFAEDMQVVCERFTVIYRDTATPGLGRP